MGDYKVKLEEIVIPVDFSAGSQVLVDYALVIAKHKQVFVRVIHCIGSEEDFEKAQSLFESNFSSYADQFKELHSKLVFECLTGKLIDVLTELNEQSVIDLIIMNAIGENNRSWFGNKTHKVLSRVICPTLVIPQNINFKGISNIVYATDMDPMSDEDAILVLKDLGVIFNAEVRLVNVRPKEKKHASRKRKFEQYREEDYFGEDVDHVFKKVIANDVINGVNFYLDKKGDVDMVAVLARQHSFMDRLLDKSHTERMMEEVNQPLLVMHDV